MKNRMNDLKKPLTDDEIDKLSLNVIRLVIAASFLIVLLCSGRCIWLMWIVTKVATS